MLPGDGLHTGVLREAAHEQAVDAAIARGADNAAHQFGADALVLHVGLDRERGFTFRAPAVAELLQFCDGPDGAVLDVAVDDAAIVEHAARIVLDEGFGDAVGEAHPPRVLVEPQKMVAEGVRLRGQKLANGAAQLLVRTHVWPPSSGAVARTAAGET